MAAISTIICCQNAEDTIGPACASVDWCDELIVVDSGSTDATPRIARRFADTFVEEPWRGYGEQKIFAADLASNDWIFILDADETCSPELAKEIRALSESHLGSHDVYRVPRRNYMYGRHVRAWDPDRQSRLIHRRRVTWTDTVLHDDCKPTQPDRLCNLNGALEHKRHSRFGFEDYFSGRRLDARLLMVAKDMFESGRRCSMLDLLCRPWLAQLKFLIFKGGFLQGSFGLMLAQKTAVTTQLKYAALWAVQNGVADGQRFLDEVPEVELPQVPADAASGSD